jgi:hypothetical protein
MVGSLRRSGRLSRAHCHWPVSELHVRRRGTEFVGVQLLPYCGLLDVRGQLPATGRTREDTTYVGFGTVRPFSGLTLLI